MFPCQGHRDTFSHSDRFSEPWWRPSGGSGNPTLPAPLGRCWDCCCSSSSSSCPSCRFSLCACCPSCRFPWPSAPCPSKSSSWPSLCWKSPHPCFQKLWLAPPPTWLNWHLTLVLDLDLGLVCRDQARHHLLLVSGGPQPLLYLFWLERLCDLQFSGPRTEVLGGCKPFNTNPNNS